MDPMTPQAKLARLAGKYKYALLILLIGLALMLLPNPSDQDEPEPTQPAIQEPENLEAKLELALSKISGAGKVEVVLTEAVSPETIYQSDTQYDSDDQRTQRSESTVLIEDSDHQRSGLVRRVDGPVYQGALVVCQGGDDPQVKLAIVQAVGCVTGLGADQISVVKMK